jgi:plasmid stabilization system protein ParE
MAEIGWTAEAVRRLEEIFEFVAASNPRAAGEVTSGIFERAQVLRDFPQIGYLYRRDPEGEIRVLLHGHYRIAYLIRSDRIDILGVFHAALDIERLLGSRE